MIPKTAVKKYLEQAKDDHLWIKQIPRPALINALSVIDPPPSPSPLLHTHQLACLLLGIAYPRFAFWLDMGTGKTLLSLELLRYWFGLGTFKKALIFLTSDKAFPTWEKQIKRFNISLPYCLLEGSAEEKWRAVDECQEGLMFISYPGAVALTTIAVPTKGKKRKNRWVLDRKAVARLGREVGALILDESTRVANHGSLTFDLVAQLRKSAPIRYALAGRPFGRDPTALWSQHYLIDDGETLGPTLGMFREAFFTSRPNPWVDIRRRQYIREYKFDHRLQGKLSCMIQHRSIAYAADECIDLPQHRTIIEEVRFPAEAGAYYARAIEKIKAAKGDMREIKNVFLRMRQLSSGFVGFINDETGEKAQVAFEENPKFDRLMELLTELPQDRKAVVFYDFTWSGSRITTHAAKLGLDPIWLWSGTDDYKGDLRRFEEVPNCRVAVVQSRVGAYSLDGLQVANYLFFYESPVSVIDREQAERRVRRQGQKYKIFQYDLVTRGSMDLKILAYHSQGEDLLKALLRNPAIVND